jgi:RimJ/RimL family protein N-acetyltransferase
VRLAKAYPDGPLVFGNDAIIAEFVRRRVPEVIDTGFGPCTTIGVIRGKKLLGGVIYHMYQPAYKSVMVSYAFDSPKWISPEVIGSFAAFPFLQLGVNRLWTLTPRKNKRSRRLVEFLGFKLEGCARKGYGNDDAMIYGMLKHECRWIKDEQEPASSARAA